jgi:hypothetical protein
MLHVKKARAVYIKLGIRGGFYNCPEQKRALWLNVRGMRSQQLRLAESLANSGVAALNLLPLSRGDIKTGAGAFHDGKRE